MLIVVVTAPAQLGQRTTVCLVDVAKKAIGIRDLINRGVRMLVQIVVKLYVVSLNRLFNVITREDSQRISRVRRSFHRET